ncbi:MAG TPA: serine hydrolase domain-containing protein [Saprospiraceae bacterium]|nr:serine hydrolase domain-containing protein [Saprospiraceae bacterium]
MKHLFIWGFLLLGALWAEAQEACTSTATDSICRHYFERYRQVGMAVGIVHGDEAYQFAAGATDHSGRFPVTDSTLFHLASVTKLFTATAILQLAEAGKLRLDDALTKHIPEFSMRDERYRDIQLQHLLTHSSGLMWDNKLKNSPDDAGSMPLFINQLKKKKLAFQPGEKMSYSTYSNAGFDLLGMVVERVSGQSYDQYIPSRIWSQAGIAGATFYYETAEKALLALPQKLEGRSQKVRMLNRGLHYDSLAFSGPWPFPTITHPVYGEEYEHNASGNAIASAAELRLWMRHLLDIYRHDKKDGVLGRQRLADMWDTHQSATDSKAKIGWGWWISDEPFGKMVFHVGNNPGFSSILLLYPDHDFGIVVLCNSNYAQLIVWNRFTEDLARVWLGR